MLWSTVLSDQAIKETVQIAQCPQTGTQQTTKWVSSLTARVVSRQALTLHSFADRSWTAGSMDGFTSGVSPIASCSGDEAQIQPFNLLGK